MAEWVDVTSRLVTPQYLDSDCSDVAGWAGWDGVTSASSKPLAFSGGIWQMSPDNELPTLCGGDACGLGPVPRLAGLLFDAPISGILGARVRYRIEAGAANLFGHADPADNPLLLVGGYLSPAVEGVTTQSCFPAPVSTLAGFEGNGCSENPSASLLANEAAYITDEDQIAEWVFASEGASGPATWPGIWLLLGGREASECPGITHNARDSTTSERVLPWWVPPLQVWLLLDEPSQFWRDFVACREASA